MEHNMSVCTRNKKSGKLIAKYVVHCTSPLMRGVVYLKWPFVRSIQLLQFKFEKWIWPAQGNQSVTTAVSSREQLSTTHQQTQNKTRRLGGHVLWLCQCAHELSNKVFFVCNICMEDQLECGGTATRHRTSPLKLTYQACSHGIVCRIRPLQAPALWSVFVWHKRLR